jgi:ParB-like chromosome segregation protein Spo0J
MEKLKIEYVSIDSIKPYENNAKLHPKEQVEQIKKSIEMFGMNDPIGIWKDEIVEGHGRLLACKELDINEVPVIRLDHLSDEERKAYILAHNKLTMNSDFDIDILNDELEDITDIDMSDFGFDLDYKEDFFEIERNDLSDKDFEKFEIIIKCENEKDLEEKYEKLVEEGYECQISTL